MDGVETTGLISLQDGKLLTEHCIALAQEPVKQALKMVAILLPPKNIQTSG